MNVLVLLVLVGVALASSEAKSLRPVAKPAIQLRRTNLHRITNGHNAEPGEFPYQLSYQWEGAVDPLAHVCGAAILSESYGLTAGHYITLVPEIGLHKIVAGINQLSARDTEGQVIEVTGRHVHPEYDPPSSGVGPHDLAVLQFAEPLVFGDLVQPIPLTDGNLQPLGPAVVSGWGYTTAVGTVTPEDLQTVDLEILDFMDCWNAIGGLLGDGEENPFIEDANICTGPLDGEKTVCGGDSGGPLTVEGKHVGIVSWGYYPCGHSGAPSVFTNTANYLDWIKETAQLQ